LQKNRGMIVDGVDAITGIHIKLKDYDDAETVVALLKGAFPPGMVNVRTWEEKQGLLLSAVEVETAILNVLLFMIIAVAGFGILAIFFMIVVEKTRDIGILKSLGASSGGVMSIFLSYGLALGMVGSAAGVVIGLLFVHYINEIEDGLSWLTGRKVFDEKIYYFFEIPTEVNPITVTWVAFGAIAIAVLASVLPARRASRLHPVRALRYE
jgi:lipoprotein-releasing system permease protein